MLGLQYRGSDCLSAWGVIRFCTCHHLPPWLWNTRCHTASVGFSSDVPGRMVGWLSTLSADLTTATWAVGELTRREWRFWQIPAEPFMPFFVRLRIESADTISLVSSFYFLYPSHCNKAEYLFPSPQRSSLLKGVWDRAHIRQHVCIYVQHCVHVCAPHLSSSHRRCLPTHTPSPTYSCVFLRANTPRLKVADLEPRGLVEERPLAGADWAVLSRGRKVTVARHYLDRRRRTLLALQMRSGRTRRSQANNFMTLEPRGS